MRPHVDGVEVGGPVRSPVRGVEWGRAVLSTQGDCCPDHQRLIQLSLRPPPSSMVATGNKPSNSPWPSSAWSWASRWRVLGHGQDCAVRRVCRDCLAARLPASGVLRVFVKHFRVSPEGMPVHVSTLIQFIPRNRARTANPAKQLPGTSPSSRFTFVLTRRRWELFSCPFSRIITSGTGRFSPFPRGHRTRKWGSKNSDPGGRLTTGPTLESPVSVSTGMSVHTCVCAHVCPYMCVPSATRASLWRELRGCRGDGWEGPTCLLSGLWAKESGTQCVGWALEPASQFWLLGEGGGVSQV